MEQFGRIKRAHPDAILFFRVGDFYETFHDDAVAASRLLGITLTSRNKNDPHPIPLAGIPWHQRDVYVARLLRLGRRVAICEQLEDPAQAKGLVDRGVTEVLTPGSVVSDAFLVAGESNYLAALVLDEAEPTAGVALVEASTGEFLAGEMPVEDAAAELGRYPVAECLIAAGAGLPKALEAALYGAKATTRLPAARFAAEGAHGALAAHFGEKALAALPLGPLAERAAAAALGYVAEVQGSALSQVRTIAPLALREHLGVDPSTRRALELFEPAAGGDPSHTLWAVLNRTCTSAGARRLRAMLERPLVDPEKIERRLDQVEALVEDGARRRALRIALGETYDLERLSARAACGKANARDLVALRETLRRVPAIAARLADGAEALAELARDLDAEPALVDLLTRALVDEPPAGLKEGGLIRPGHDAALDELRETAAGGKRWLVELETRERAATGIPSLKIGYNRVFGYYIEVTRAHAARVPEHYERRQTLTTAERYVTAALREKESQVLGAEERLRQAEYERFLELRAEAGARFDSLLTTARALAALDAIASLAELADDAGWTRPRVDGGARLRLRASRHPVVERLLPPGRFVPNDVDLEPSARQIVLLTGPNMAGKSTYMRQVALVVLLAQVGSFVPCDAAEIGVVDQIFTRVGAGDHVAGGQSTFMVEMLETATILRRATARSLVVLDEVGRGTSTYDGMSLAWAVVEELHRQGTARPRALFATHYHELTKLAEHLPRVVNRSILVEEEGDEVAFLHQVVDGPADRSYGIHVARLAGIPERVIARARAILALLEAAAPDPLASAGLVAEPAGSGAGAPGGGAPGGGASRTADRAAAAPKAAVARAKRDDADTLPLFAAADPAAALAERLAALELDGLSPKEALALLYEWQQLVRGAAAGR
jgi:DNA mismatch repair protein MutS